MTDVPRLGLALGEAQHALAFRGSALLHLGLGREVASADVPPDPWTFPFREPWEPRRLSAASWGLDGQDRCDGFELVHREEQEHRLTIVLRDTTGAELTVEHEADPATDLVTCRQQLVNRGAATLHVTGLPSFRLHVPPGPAQLTSLYGAWGDEATPQTTTLPRGTTILAGTHGKTGFEALPWFALDGADGTTFGQLAWSGNWELRFERHWAGDVTISGGSDRRGHRQVLAPGGVIRTPDAILGWTGEGLDDVSARLHARQRRTRRRPSGARVQFNSFYAQSDGRIHEDLALRQIDVAAELGCEVYVLDAGWHFNAGHDAPDWNDQLGDWLVDLDRFPRGLGAVADHARARGLAFGIWMEPEAAVPGSAVLRDHPDWFHRRAGAGVTTGRRHLIDLGHADAWAWVLGRVSAVLTQTGATWLKWDFNAELGAGGDRSSGTQGVIEHVAGLYRLWDVLHERFDGLIIENCSSGGGRLDVGATSHSDVTWMSDVVAPASTLAIRFGISRALCPEAMNAWLVHWPPSWHWFSHEGNSHPAFGGDGQGDLAFRARVAMMGAFGISAPIPDWTAQDVAEVREHVATYKRLRPLIEHGRQVRLTPDPPRDGTGTWAAMAFLDVAGSQGAVLAFRLADGEPAHALQVPGLDAGTTFSVTRDADDAEIELTGAQLQAGELLVTAEAPLRSTIVWLRAAGRPSR